MNRKELINSAFQECGSKASLMDLRRVLAYLENVDLNSVFFNEYFEVDYKIEEKFRQLVIELKNDKPVSKIIHSRAFWKYDFFVNDSVLDPRADSETVIEAVLENFSKDADLSILDLCTGSGCLIISLLKEFSNAKGVGIDISCDAIKVAQRNALELLEPNRLELFVADITNFLYRKKFDIIISNPPYIPTQDIALLDKNVREYDPLIALDGGDDGLKFYRIIYEKYDSLLKEGGCLFLEIGYNQAELVSEMFNNKYNVCIKKDANFLDRVVICKKK